VADPVLLLGGAALLFAALKGRKTAATAPPPEKPPETKPDQPSDLFGDLVKDLSGDLGKVAAGAAFGFQFSQGFNKIVLQTGGSTDQGFLGTVDATKGISTVGFTLAGGLILVALLPGVIVAGITLWAITIVLLVYILLHPHPISFPDDRRDDAIQNYDGARREVMARVLQALVAKFGNDTALKPGELEFYAASFADGFIRTQDAIGFNALLKSGANLSQLAHERVGRGGFVGLENAYGINQVTNKAAVEAAAADLHNVVAGGAVINNVAGFSGVPTTAALARWKEPHFPTLVGELARHYPGSVPITSFKWVGFEYRRADLRAGFNYTWCTEHFVDSPKGKAFYDAGAAQAWGAAYVAAMINAQTAGEDPAVALQQGKAAGVIHSAATTEKLVLSLSEGATLEVRWKDFATQALPPPPTE
jgi:hypothetical protein